MRVSRSNIVQCLSNNLEKRLSEVFFRFVSVVFGLCQHHFKVPNALIRCLGMAIGLCRFLFLFRSYIRSFLFDTHIRILANCLEYKLEE